MSLSYDLSGCADFEELSSEQEWPITNTIIFSTMVLGMGSITEANVGKFIERTAAYQTVSGPLMQRVADGQIEGVPVTADMIRRRIGLKTNVTDTTDAKFKRHMADLLMRNAQQGGGR
jgi:hypothetical protein